MTTDTPTRKAYAARRAEGWLAPYALAWARDEVALSLAEHDDRARVVIEDDDDFNPRDASDIDEIINDDIDGLTTGRYGVYVVRLLVPDTCPHCAHALADTFRDAGSVWGCVIDMSACNGYPSRDPYLRSIAHDLAREAGVIA